MPRENRHNPNRAEGKRYNRSTCEGEATAEMPKLADRQTEEVEERVAVSVSNRQLGT